MSDYRIEAATKEEWAERAMSAEAEAAYLRSEVKYLRVRIRELDSELDLLGS